MRSRAGSSAVLTIALVVSTTAQASKPYATIADSVLTLHPSGASLQIPASMREPGPDRQFTVYLTPADLERVKAPSTDEWDRAFSRILNAVLPFDAACVGHLGSEPFGPGSKSFADLQMRVYAVNERLQPLVQRVQRFSAQAATLQEHFADAAATTTAAKEWTLTTLTYTMRQADYAAPARLDVYSREFGPQTTVVLVFMSSPNRRWSWTTTIDDIVTSFTWPERH